MECVRIDEVKVSVTEGNRSSECHYNSSFNPVLGYYFVKDSHNILHAFKHSVTNIGNELVDTTPNGNNNYIVFAHGSKYSYEHLTYLEKTILINKEKQESEMLYYVYGLIDPRDDMVFYIGKGRDDRWKNHFIESSLNKEGNTKKTAKIKKLNSLGYEPHVEFFAQNIEDEQLAYSIEASLILKYGRIGYEEYGILTNVCADNRPPNHKGRTYVDMMGEDRAAELTKTKRALQLAAGGYGPTHHSEKTKARFKLLATGYSNPNASDLTEEDIISIGKDMYKVFGGIISKAKWSWYCKFNNIPVNILTSFRFSGRHIFDVFKDEIGMEISSRDTGFRWLYSDTNKIRMYDWQIALEGMPSGYKLGRGGSY
jgi:hypothetical protein